MRRKVFAGGCLSVLAFLVVVGLLVHMGLSVKVTADSAGADGDGNAWGGVKSSGTTFLFTGAQDGGGGSAWMAQSLDDIAAGRVNGAHMNSDGSITIDGFNGTGNFHASGATIMCPAGTTHLYRYSLVATRDGYGYNKGDLVGLMGIDGNSNDYNSSVMGGRVTYNTSVAGALSWSSVEQKYGELYNQGLVHVGWGGGTGLSWFCSSGDGTYIPPTTEDPCTRKVFDGYTTVDVKVMNTRLKGAYSGWRQFMVNNSLEYKDNYQVTYAMPTDEIQWAHCYNPGVQSNYRELSTTLTKTTINGSVVKNADPDWWHNSNRTDFYAMYDGKDLKNEPSNIGHGFYGPELTTMGAEMNARDLPWENKWWISRSNVWPWNPNSNWYFEYNLGVATKQTRREYSTVNRVGDVGQELVESDETGSPRKFVVERYSHAPWNVTNVKYRLYEYDRIEYDYPWHEDYVGEWDSCPDSWNGSGQRSFAYNYEDDWSGIYISVYKCTWQTKDPRKVYEYHPCRGKAECEIDRWGDWRYKDVGDEHNSSNVDGDLETYHAYSSAKVYVPYNFINTASLEIEGKQNGDIVYSGDQIKIAKAAVIVHPRDNGATEAGNGYPTPAYATIVRNPKAGFIAYVSSSPQGITGWGGSSDPCANVGASVIDGRRLCKYLAYNVDSFNSGGDLRGVEEPLSDFNNKTQMVFDANAGDYMCYAIAVYPSDSGGPTNWQDPEGSHAWTYSDTICLKIAKKPYFGVYGGSIYSAAKVATLSMNKNNIFGDSKLDYETIWRNGIGERKYFGSFAEQSVFGIKAITGLASGSAYKENVGINNNDFCKYLVPLTMANAGKDVCAGNNPNATGLMGDIDKISVDKSSYIDFWLKSAAEVGPGPSDDFGASTRYYSNTGADILYTYINKKGDDDKGVEIGSRITNTNSGEWTPTININNGVTRLLKIDGNLTIRKNIKYNQSGNPISSAGKIPQVIILADNIYIDCHVTQIDAILIGGVVNTCEAYSSPNTPVASNPLIIRGVIIADELYLRRTYGAAVDGYSGTPAETINYDTSTILWARYMAGASESNTMTEVYRTELAPRY